MYHRSYASVFVVSRAAGLHGGFREEGGDGEREGGAGQEEEEAQEPVRGVAIDIARPRQDAVLVFGMLRHIDS